ncbi:MAG TPA: acyl carrier protein [Planctomycetota bacterium]|nr:acyl carrier protein [Planctomycetota bacterium]
MTDRDAERRLREIVARVARVAPDSFGLDDDLPVVLGLDSLSSLRIAAGVEREFGVTIPDERLHALRTLRALREAATAEV